jgi:translation initiation factor IF-2
VVLVVAADDGVKPQTIEAITHAKAANVPIIVAINKTDVPGANVERIKQQLTEHELVAEEWGGKTVMAPISAKTGEGIEHLLEMIVLATDLLELKADIDSLPEGVVIEANLDKQVGPLTTLLIFSGTLRAGQIAVVGKTFGRIRSLHNDRGEQVSSAGPSQPVVVTGLKEVPQFGDQLAVVPNEKIARSMTASGAGAKSQGGEGGNTIRIILKADVGGSLAALEDSISKIKNKDATVEIISSGIGQVTENDITRAKTAGAIVIAFRLPVQKRIQELADQEGVTTKEYWIIYEAVDFLNTEVRRIATPTFTKVELGRLKVLAIFGEKGRLQVVGGEVTQGEVKSGVDIEVFRAKELLGQGKVTDLRVGKVAVDKVGQGEQCGLSVEDGPAIEKDDLLVLSEQRPD